MLYNEEGLKAFDEALFRGTGKEFEEFTNIISGCIEEINKSNNIRHIVLETWLTIDYFLQDAIGKAFKITDFNTKEYDWRTELLPKSFQTRLNIFERLLKSQESLPIDPYEHKIKLPGQFWRILMKDKDFYKQFKKLEYRYYEEYRPEIIEQEKKDEELKNIESTLVLDRSEPIQYQTNKEWYDVYKTVDKEWFKEAKYLNQARNKAAHSYNPAEIYEKLGFNGENAFEQSKDKCLKTVNTLLGVKY